MNPLIVRGLVVVAALGLRFYAGLPVDVDSALGELSMLLIGAQVFKRSGDYAPKTTSLPVRV